MVNKPLNRRSRKTKEDIYNAAVALFNEHGTAGVTMSDIAARAKTSRSTVFNHYPSKTDLYDAFFWRFTEKILEQTKARDLSRFRAALYALFEETGAEAEKYKRLLSDIAALTVGNGELAQSEKEIDSQLLEFIDPLVEQGMLEGEISDQLIVREVSVVLLGHITITNHEWLGGEQKTNLGDDLKKRFELLMNGLSPR